MFKTTRHLAISVLMLASLLAVPAASARVLTDRQAPAAITSQAPATVSQIETSRSTVGGFDWGDAGIGAAAALVLIGALTLTVSARRRDRHHAAIG